MNLVLVSRFPETMGLEQIALFPVSDEGRRQGRPITVMASSAGRTWRAGRRFQGVERPVVLSTCAVVEEPETWRIAVDEDRLIEGERGRSDAADAGDDLHRARDKKDLPVELDLHMDERDAAPSAVSRMPSRSKNSVRPISR